MKKILLILLFTTLFLKADGVNNYNEYKVDLYYANGIMIQDDEKEVQKIWERRGIMLLLNNPHLKEKIDDYSVAYNISHGRVADLWESFLQKSRLEPEYNVGYRAFKAFVFRIPYIGKPTEMLVTVAEAADSMVHDDTLNKQIEKYKESIKDGNGVVVVAHSQGNLFTTEAYQKLETWMKPYFHTIAVATPGNRIVKGDSGITFKNDIITEVPGAMNGNLKNPNRHDYYKFEKNIFGDIINEEYLYNYKSMKYHSFKYYLGYPVNEFALEKVTDKMPASMPVRKARQTNIAKDMILKWIDDKITLHDEEDSQWKITDEIDKGTKDYQVTLSHDGDSSLNILIAEQRIYPFNVDKLSKIKLYQLSTGEWVIASFGGTEILSAKYHTWEDQKDEQFYRLEGTYPVEYIKEKTCKDPSLFEVISQENRYTADWRVSVKNRETNEIQAGVYPFNLKGSLYKLENSDEWVLASCGGTDMVDNWNEQKSYEFFMLDNTEQEKVSTRFERDHDTDIVIDHQTGLQWQDESTTWLDSWYGAGRHCTALTLGGYDDWRVPTYNELIQIINIDGPLYTYEIFEHLGLVGYWSLDKKGIYPDTEEAKVVNFGLATWIYINTSQQMNTRCVRTK